MKRRTLFALAGALVLGACGGGGGGGGATPRPTISNLSYSPAALYVNDGNGQRLVDGSFDFVGAAGGVASIALSVTNASGQVVSQVSAPVQGGAGITAGTIVGRVLVNTTTAGVYMLHVSLTDLSGATSNTLSGALRITPLPWTEKTSMPNSRRAFAAAAAGTRAYVIGGELLGTGSTPGPDSALVEVFDAATGTWTTAPSMPTARKASVAAAMNGVIYVFGGTSAAAPGGLATVEAFDPATGIWTPRAAMPTARSAAAATVFGSQICVVGGTAAGSDLSTVECYDPAANTWSARAPLPLFRRSLAVATLGSSMYALGGYSGVNPPASGPGVVLEVDRYDPATNTWTNLPGLIQAREGHAAVVAGGTLYVMGGTLVAPLSSMESYDPATLRSTSRASMPAPVTGIAAVEIGGLIYVFDAAHTFEYTPANELP